MSAALLKVIGAPDRCLRRFRRAAVPLSLLAVLLLSLASSISCHTAKQAAAERSAPAASDTSSVQSTALRIKGTTEAVYSRTILVPSLADARAFNLTVTKLIPGGTKVKKGDLLAEFDRQAQMQTYIDKEAEYRKLASELAEARAKEDAARAKDETELQEAENNLKSAELEMQRLELMSRIDAERSWFQKSSSEQLEMLTAECPAGAE